MHFSVNKEVEKIINLLSHNGTAEKRSKRKGYKGTLDRTYNIIKKLCEKYNIEINTDTLVGLESLLFGLENDSMGNRYIFIHNEGEKITKAVPTEMTFTLLADDKNGSSSVLLDKIKVMIDPEKFSVNIEAPINYSDSYTALSQRIMAEAQKILNFNFKKDTKVKTGLEEPLLFNNRTIESLKKIANQTKTSPDLVEVKLVLTSEKQEIKPEEVDEIPLEVLAAMKRAKEG